VAVLAVEARCQDRVHLCFHANNAFWALLNLHWFRFLAGLIRIILLRFIIVLTILHQHCFRLLSSQVFQVVILIPDAIESFSCDRPLLNFFNLPKESLAFHCLSNFDIAERVSLLFGSWYVLQRLVHLLFLRLSCHSVSFIQPEDIVGPERGR